MDTHQKQQQFITMVQTAIITKYVCDPGDGTAPVARPMWSIQHMADAYAVAANIPGDVTAQEAAEAFVRWMFHQPLEGDDETILKIVL
jgi:hypothetical protein